MKTNNKLGRLIRKSGHGLQRGSVLVVVAILLIVIIGIAALSVDLGHVSTSRNELQNIADAAALAGAGKLGQIYASQTPPTAPNSEQQALIKEVARTVGRENKVAGKEPNIEYSDVIIGCWKIKDGDPDNNKFFPEVSKCPDSFPNAVNVTARPPASGSTPLGSVTTFFANIFGITNVGVSATATASLTAPCEMEPGRLTPFVIAQNSPYCNQVQVPIDFTSNNGCGGWQTFDIGSNDPNIQKIENTIMMNKNCTPDETNCGTDILQNGIPGKKVGDTVNLLNGNASKQSWNCLKDLYNCLKDNNGHWYAVVSVVNQPCANLNQSPTIISFATIDITGVSSNDGYVGIPGPCTPAKGCVKATVYCNNVVPPKGGGCSYYGTYGSIPGLVSKEPPQP